MPNNSDDNAQHAVSFFDVAGVGFFRTFARLLTWHYCCWCWRAGIVPSYFTTNTFCMLRSLLFFAAALSISLAACNTPNPNSANVAANSNAKKDSAAAKADEDLTPAQRATKASKKYRFDEKEAFDRCSPVEMLYKNGTKVELPASALEYLKCANEIELRNDRFFVYDDAKGFYIYDLEKKNSLVVFSKNDGVQYYSMAWSPSGHKQIVLCINYGDAAKLSWL